MNTLKEFTVVRSQRKTLSLQVTRSGEIVVKAPLRASSLAIENFVTTNSQWIITHLEKIQNSKKAIPTQFKLGEIVMYLGKELRFIPYDGTSIEVKGDELLFPKILLFRADKEMENWYKKKARDVIIDRLMFYEKQMNVTHNGLTFTDTKSQWGRCTYDNRLQFSWRLIMAPILVLNYVVVHELVHITEKNHSRKFWDRVRYFNPSFRQHVKWLSENGNSLH